MAKTEERQYAGADWLVATKVDGEISPLGETVADFLGDVFLGIYHLDRAKLMNVDWSDRYCIEVTLNEELSTFDNNTLTRLIVLAHDRLLRVEIAGHWRGQLRLTFHQRKSRTGRMSDRMPTMEDHTALIQAHYAVENGTVNDG